VTDHSSSKLGWDGIATKGVLRTQQWMLIAIAGVSLLFLFWAGLINMVGQWEQAEYSHGYLIPVVAVFMALEQGRALGAIKLKESWVGLAILAVSLGLLAIGELSALYSITHYAFLLALLGLLLAIIGWRGVRILWAPLLFLVFMIPLPDFLYNNLSSQLQLISSAIGVALIRLLGITVFLEGNVIDLGVYKLQVAEACSGLRYLFPLMSFGFLCAFVYRGAMWKRVALFLSSIPIAILMNSLRIGVIGVLVEYQGIEAAQGFLHLFEGWVVFIVCLIILFAEGLALHRLSRETASFRDAIAIDFSLAELSSFRLPPSQNRLPLLIAAAGLAIAAVASASVSPREEAAPQRKPFLDFPLAMGDWHGRDEVLSPEVLLALKLDDYLNANYARQSDGSVVNVYAAYYASQRKGASAHSPRSCIPGGGWEIESLRTVKVVTPTTGPDGMNVNRVIIAKGESRQLVYYWFQQRGRMMTNEYLVKWYLLVDALTKHRTDGAMVRLVTPIRSDADTERADATLISLMNDLMPRLDGYIPN
jgi:exosortase D (VPLPA-CTERM-specific)